MGWHWGGCGAVGGYWEAREGLWCSSGGALGGLRGDTGAMGHWRGTGEVMGWYWGGMGWHWGGLRGTGGLWDGIGRVWGGTGGVIGRHWGPMGQHWGSNMGLMGHGGAMGQHWGGLWVGTEGLGGTVGLWGGTGGVMGQYWGVTGRPWGHYGAAMGDYWEAPGGYGAAMGCMHFWALRSPHPHWLLPGGRTVLRIQTTAAPLQRCKHTQSTAASLQNPPCKPPCKALRSAQRPLCILQSHPEVHGVL